MLGSDERAEWSPDFSFSLLAAAERRINYLVFILLNTLRECKQVT